MPAEAFMPERIVDLSRLDEAARRDLTLLRTGKDRGTLRSITGVDSASLDFSKFAGNAGVAKDLAGAKLADLERLLRGRDSGTVHDATGENPNEVSVRVAKEGGIVDAKDVPKGTRASDGTTKSDKNMTAKELADALQGWA